MANYLKLTIKHNLAILWFLKYALTQAPVDVHPIKPIHDLNICKYV